jgi:aminopeptidase
MTDTISKEEAQDILEERSRLVRARIAEIPQETLTPEPYRTYFTCYARFLTCLTEIYDRQHSGAAELPPLADWQQEQEVLYRDIRPENYGESFANPAWAVKTFGETAGRMLSLLAAELHAGIGWAYEGCLEELVILQELFTELYGCFCGGETPDLQEANQTIYWYFHDYSRLFTERQVHEMLLPADNYYTGLLMHSDLTDPRTIYQYGLPVGENEIRTAQYLNTLSEEEIQAMADTFTEGYRIGFEITGKDIHRKKTVSLHYAVGFERMMRAAVKNFEAMGLQVTIGREPFSTFRGIGAKRGVYSTSVNRQFDFDHREDRAFYLDKAFVEHRLDMLRQTFETYRQEAAVFGGPAVQEVFGEEPFGPENKAEAIHFSEEQQQLSVYYMSEAGQITNRYIPGEERSFTIIAYPIPAIGAKYPEIFAETVAINTLDYKKYQTMQQKIIDVLDTGTQVRILGTGGNETDLTVSIWPLEHPDTQTAFENCVADVNIPVGEVFTSPVLQGTSGLLHVSLVYLNGLQFRDLKLTFTDGMVTDYTCANFDEEEENRRYIRDNVLMHHETLPMGEFAIGTNTRAYRMAKTYAIADKLPILIAEKTGPHFAVGDTCYSHAEDTAVFNPNGKEIMPRDNAVSLKRKENPADAYFNCHTDVTIPFEELGSITVIRRDGSTRDIIRNGRFAVPGTEELNIPLES